MNRILRWTFQVCADPSEIGKVACPDGVVVGLGVRQTQLDIIAESLSDWLLSINIRLLYVFDVPKSGMRCRNIRLGPGSRFRMVPQLHETD